MGETTRVEGLHVPDTVQLNYVFNNGTGTATAAMNPSTAYYEPGTYQVFVIG